MRERISWLTYLIKSSILITIILIWVWGVLALYYAVPDPVWLRNFIACVFGITLPLAFLLCRSFIKGLLVSLLVLGILGVWWHGLQPTGDKDWAADVARISHGTVQDNHLTMYNVRNFRYLGGHISSESWETREYDLDRLAGLDLYLSYWASDHIAHAILSWAFSDGQYLAISIETRKDRNQEYSAIKGFFKQYELAYVAADEKDLIRLRTNYRRERVYAYRLKVSQERSRTLLLDYLAEMNRLSREPEFYDALTRNCTTTIRIHANAIRSNAPTPMDWRILASGHLDELLYEHQLLSQDMSFTELRRKSRVDLRMQQESEEKFSKQLRLGLPDPNRSLTGE